MKRILATMLSCSMLITSVSAFAEEVETSNSVSISESASSKGISVKDWGYTDSVVDGGHSSLRNVGVNFNDSPLQTSFPAVIYDGRTMVPLRDIAEATGADVEWDTASKGITVKSGNKTLYLTIDSDDVLINGIKKTIDYGVPPKLIGHRGASHSSTMVPLRFISEELGCKVDWDQPSFSANISYEKLGSNLGSTELSDISSKDLNRDQLSSVSIALSSISSPKVYSPSESSDKIVIDIPNSKIMIGGSYRKYFETHISKFPVESVSASQIDDKNVRVTIELSTETSFEPIFSGNNVTIKFPEISVNKLSNVAVENIGGREAIVLRNSASKDFRDFKLSGAPGRIVLDLKDTLLNMSDKSLSSSTVSKVRTSQYENSSEYESGSLVTRVVLDLKSEVKDYSYTTERRGNDIAVFIDNKTATPPPSNGGDNGGNPEKPSIPGDKPPSGGNQSISYTHYNATIDEMVKAQSAKLTVTDKYRNSPAYVHGSQIQTANGLIGTIKEDNTPVRAEKSATSFVFGRYNSGAIVTIVGTENGWHQIKYSGWRNAKPDDIKYYLNPDNFSIDTASGFQFLDLSKLSGISASELDKSVLSGKGILSGKGRSFIEAGSKYGVNEIYLVSHAFLETGNGTSKLASGVLVSQVDGKSVEPKVVYNMFGIGATDANALKFGSERAYKEGWFTPEKAIVGGAKFISEGYITDGQNTLYEMRWNPNINKVWHQYATDIGWAYKQVNNMKKLYDLCSGYTLKYDIPVYKK